MELFWENEGWQKDDKHLSALLKSPFVRKFPVINAEQGPALYIVRGPRQVGKSSLLKTMLSNFKNPKEAFYLSCENVGSYQELSAILKSIRTTRSLILLDEVSFVDEWSRAVKHEIDSGYKGVLVVTGSHASDLRAGGDLMPGRFGYGREFVLMPMSFEEFELARSDAGWPVKSRFELIQQYLKIGGMPASVAWGGPEGNVSTEILDTYERWIVGDALRAGKNKAFILGLLSQLALCMSTSVSLQTLAKKTEIASHHTVQEYIQFLEDSFALRTAYALDPDTGASRFRKEKKFYFTDPVLYWIGVRSAGIPIRDDWEAAVAEMVGYEELARRAALSRERLGYYSSSAGEIDYFSPKKWAVELKWSEVAHNLSPAYHKIVLPQKIVWTKNNFLKEWPI